MAKTASPDPHVFPLGLDPSLAPNFVVDGYIYDLYDGDTVYYHASLGYYQFAAFQTGRLLHIDAPEIHNAQTHAAAEASKQHLVELMAKYAINRNDPNSVTFGKLFKLLSKPAPPDTFHPLAVAQREKFGRWLVELIGADDNGAPVNLNKCMLDDGFAVHYEGGTKGVPVTTPIVWSLRDVLPARKRESA